MRLVFMGLLMGFLCILCSNSVSATEASQLINLEVRPEGANKTQVVLEFSRSVIVPKSFSVENPPAVVFDFPTVKNKLSKALSNQTLSDSILKKINVIETDAKTRMVVDMKQLAFFDTEVKGNILTITFEDSMLGKAAVKKIARNHAGYQIKSIDFRRGEHGEGRLEVDLSTSKAVVDFKEESGKINIAFLGAAVQERLIKRYDVTDFGTPIQTIVVSKSGPDVYMEIDASGNYDKIAYQLDNKFIVEVRNITKAEKDAFKELTGKYVGDKLSLNFQDVEIRAILLMIADFVEKGIPGFNIIVPDSVKGNITLRLQNVPWDQALDIILKSEGLDKRQYGNVMLVGPATEIAAREKVELDSQKQMEDLGAMKSELIQINYANAEDLSALLKDKTNSLMTSRGTVSVDKRTNTLLIQDIPVRLDEIKALLKKLDVAVRQVEISTQIVTADNTLESTLGMRFGGGANAALGNRRLGVGSNVDRARAIGDFTNAAGKSVVPPSNAVISSANLGANPVLNTPGPTVNNSEGLFSDLGAIPGAAGTAGFLPAKVGLALAKLPNGTLLDLELQAMEYESKSKTVARPKLVTLDQNKASVEKGVDIPYLQASSSGATSVAYKTAALKLDVTPHITPDDKISLDLAISNDTQGPSVQAGPVVNTNRLETKVLVDNGETVVLGGVLQVTDNKQLAKVPFFGDLPIIGGLFRSKYAKYNPTELIIFLTPRIINPLIKDQHSGISDYRESQNNNCYVPPKDECIERSPLTKKQH